MAVGDREFPGTISVAWHYLHAMSSGLVKQFEGFAACCLELARRAETTASRRRLVQMAREYRQATALISHDPSRNPAHRNAEVIDDELHPVVETQ